MYSSRLSTNKDERKTRRQPIAAENDATPDQPFSISDKMWVMSLFQQTHKGNKLSPGYLGFSRLLKLDIHTLSDQINLSRPPKIKAAGVYMRPEWTSDSFVFTLCLLYLLLSLHFLSHSSNVLLSLASYKTKEVRSAEDGCMRFWVEKRDVSLK